MIHFICRVLLPKNTGLREKAIDALKYVKPGNFKEGIKILPFRGEDIPCLVEEFISKGSNAIGFTGEDLFAEYCLNNQSSLSIIKRIPWKDESFVFKKPALCLLGPKERDLNSYKGTVVCTVNRKYRALSENFLEKLRRDGLKVIVKEASGNLEKTVEQGIADLCIDIVCSGRSLEECDLQILDKVFESDIVLIGIVQTELFELKALAEMLRKRIEGKDCKSYTWKLLRDKKLLCKKINEEAFELIEAALEGKKSKVVWEAADLLYFVSVLLMKEGVPVDAVFNELRRRSNEKKGN